MLLSSHHLSEVEQTCSQVVVMNHGRLVVERHRQRADRLGAAPSTSRSTTATGRASVLAGVEGVARVEQQGDGLVVDLRSGRRSDLAAALVGAGLRLETIMPTQRLEDAFLELLEPAPAAARPATAA